MALQGVRDKEDLVIMAGWDAKEMKAFELADGTTYDRVAAEVRVALSALSQELATDPLWASLVSFTDKPELKYRVGAASNMNPFTEYGKSDANRAERTGHMIPLQAFDEIVGWTWKYLKEADIEDVRADIRNAIDAIRNRWRISILGRILKRGDDSGKAAGLGSTGLSAGFATAAANTGVDFVPPQFGGKTFTVDHEHYVATDGGYTVAVFTDAEAELKEHGLVPPFDFIISPSDEAAVKALSETSTGANDGFVPVAKSIVAYGANQDLAKLPTISGGQSYYIGTISNFKTRVVSGMPAGYGFAFKSYGLNNPMNPLVIRLEKGSKLPTPILMTDPRAGNGTTPLQNMMLYLEMGVGVKMRTNGTTRKVNGATWVDGVAA